MKRKILILAAVVCLVFAALGFFVLRDNRSAPLDFLDAQRGLAYTNLIETANLISGDPDKSTNITAFLSQNDNVIKSVTQAIQNETEAPESTYDAESMAFPRMVAVRNVARAMVAKGKQAETEARYGEAADLYLNSILLGQRIERGPLINFLVGCAIEKAGLRALNDLAPKLPSTNSAAASRKLRDFNRTRIPFDEVVRREQYFMTRNAKSMVEIIRLRLTGHLGKITAKARKEYEVLQGDTETIATRLN